MKVRARSIEDSSLVYGGLSYTEKGGPFAKHIDWAEVKEEDGTITAVQPPSIERFSGVLDCNGIEIYENDVVKPTKIKDVRNVVRFVDGFFYRYKVLANVIGEDRHYFNPLGSCEVKVIGLAEDFNDTKPLKNWNILNDITGKSEILTDQTQKL
jgi:hypothetical protein